MHTVLTMGKGWTTIAAGGIGEARPELFGESFCWLSVNPWVPSRAALLIREGTPVRASTGRGTQPPLFNVCVATLYLPCEGGEESSKTLSLLLPYISYFRRYRVCGPEA